MPVLFCVWLPMATYSFVGLVAVATAATTTTVAAAAFVSARAGFVDIQRTTIKVSAVQGADCGSTFFLARHFNKAEAARLTGILVGDDAGTVNSTMGLESGEQIVFVRIER